MGRHEVLANVASELASLRDGDALTRAVRRKAAIAAHEKGRLLGDDELEAVARREMLAQMDYEPEPNDDGETIDLTDAEWESLDDEQRVTVSGLPYVVSGGKAYRASIRPEHRHESVAAQVASEQRLAVRTVKLAQGIDLFEDELWEADGLVCCPICGTSDCTLVYDDSFGTTYHCNVCNRPFTVEPEPASLMFEDELIPEEDLVMCCEPQGSEIAVTVWHGEQPLLDLTVASREKARILGSDIVTAYDNLYGGVEVASIESGKRMAVQSVDGDELVMNGRVASRCAVASSIAIGRLMVVASPIRETSCRGKDAYSDYMEDEIISEGLAAGQWVADEEWAKRLEKDKVYESDAYNALLDSARALLASSVSEAVSNGSIQISDGTYSNADEGAVEEWIFENAYDILERSELGPEIDSFRQILGNDIVDEIWPDVVALLGFEGEYWSIPWLADMSRRLNIEPIYTPRADVDAFGHPL